MTLSRTLARPLLAAMFIYGGWDALRNPDGKVKKAEPVVLPLATKVPILPQDAEKLVRINGAVMVVAGSFMAIGKFRRLAALVLIGSLLPTTYAGHRFWEEEDEATRAQQRIHFLKNLGLLGGLILEVFDTEGAPSLRWRAAHRGRKQGSKGGNDLARQISGGIGGGIAAAQGLLSHAAQASVPAVGQARQAATRLPEMSNRAWKKAQQRAAQIDIAQQRASLAGAQAAMLRAVDSYRVAATPAQKKTAKVDLANQQVALKEAQRALRQAVKRGRVKAQPVLAQSAQALQQARAGAQPVIAHGSDALQQAMVSAQPVLAGAAKTLMQAKANVEPVLSSAASRAVEAWSHAPSDS